MKRKTNLAGILLSVCMLPVLLFFAVQCAGTAKAGGGAAGTGPEARTIEADLEEYVPGEEEVMGFGILKRIPGLWHGPVSTTTPAGSFPMWYVDFRPVSPGQVSQYSNLDPKTINYISFFIVKHEGALKVAMRTEGVFDEKGCVTYEVIDTVREEDGYYRFSDFNAGDDRAYTEYTFTEDEFLMEVYTNNFNQVSPLEIHSRWKAKLGDRTAAAQAIADHNFPQPVMVKDFTDVFRHRSESIYFDLSKDPYDSLTQPYVGTVTVNIAVDEKLPVKKDHEFFLLLTTESLFDGLRYDEDNMRYVSKYVFLPPGTEQYTFTNVHPGTYYIYSYNDINGDRRHKSGDYICSDVHNSFTLPPEGAVTVDTKIDYVIP